MVIFLGLNGWDLDAPEIEVVSTMLAVAAGRCSESGSRKKWVTEAHRAVFLTALARSFRGSSCLLDRKIIQEFRGVSPCHAQPLLHTFFYG